MPFAQRPPPPPPQFQPSRGNSTISGSVTSGHFLISTGPLGESVRPQCDGADEEQNGNGCRQKRSVAAVAQSNYLSRVGEKATMLPFQPRSLSFLYPPSSTFSSPGKSYGKFIQSTLGRRACGIFTQRSRSKEEIDGAAPAPRSKPSLAKSPPKITFGDFFCQDVTLFCRTNCSRISPRVIMMEMHPHQTESQIFRSLLHLISLFR